MVSACKAKRACPAAQHVLKRVKHGRDGKTNLHGFIRRNRADMAVQALQRKGACSLAIMAQNGDNAACRRLRVRTPWSKLPPCNSKHHQRPPRAKHG